MSENQGSRRFKRFLQELYERFRHDDGSSPPTEIDSAQLDEEKKRLMEALGDLVVFQNVKEFDLYNPSSPYYWRTLYERNASRDQSGSTRPPQLPPDPLSDDEFYRVQKRVCRMIDHTSLLEQSMIRCEKATAGAESDAESLSAEDDWEDIEEEFALYESIVQVDKSENEDKTDDLPQCEAGDDKTMQVTSPNERGYVEEGRIGCSSLHQNDDDDDDDDGDENEDNDDDDGGDENEDNEDDDDDDDESGPDCPQEDGHEKTVTSKPSSPSKTSDTSLSSGTDASISSSSSDSISDLEGHNSHYHSFARVQNEKEDMDVTPVIAEAQIDQSANEKTLCEAATERPDVQSDNVTEADVNDNRPTSIVAEHFQPRWTLTVSMTPPSTSGNDRQDLASARADSKDVSTKVNPAPGCQRESTILPRLTKEHARLSIPARNRESLVIQPTSIVAEHFQPRWTSTVSMTPPSTSGNDRQDLASARADSKDVSTKVNPASGCQRESTILPRLTKEHARSSIPTRNRESLVIQDGLGVGGGGGSGESDIPRCEAKESVELVMTRSQRRSAPRETSVKRDSGGINKSSRSSSSNGESLASRSRAPGRPKGAKNKKTKTNMASVGAPLADNAPAETTQQPSLSRDTDVSGGGVSSIRRCEAQEEMQLTSLIERCHVGEEREVLTLDRGHSSDDDDGSDSSDCSKKSGSITITLRAPSAPSRPDVGPAITRPRNSIPRETSVNSDNGGVNKSSRNSGFNDENLTFCSRGPGGPKGAKNKNIETKRAIVGATSADNAQTETIQQPSVSCDTGGSDSGSGGGDGESGIIPRCETKEETQLATSIERCHVRNEPEALTLVKGHSNDNNDSFNCGERAVSIKITVTAPLTFSRLDVERAITFSRSSIPRETSVNSDSGDGSSSSSSSQEDLTFHRLDPNRSKGASRKTKMNKANMDATSAADSAQGETTKRPRVSRDTPTADVTEDFQPSLCSTICIPLSAAPSSDEHGFNDSSGVLKSDSVTDELTPAQRRLQELNIKPKLAKDGARISISSIRKSLVTRSLKLKQRKKKSGEGSRNLQVRRAIHKP